MHASRRDTIIISDSCTLRSATSTEKENASETILDIGIRLILFLQGLGEWLMVPMKFLSLLGTEEFYLLIMPLFYWCIDARIGLRLGLLLLTSAAVNDVLKLAFHAPRPYWYDVRVQAFATESTFGLPSGHAQNAVAVWGGLAASINKRWAWAGVFVLAVLIGLSRVYLGVHFPTDVIVGWLVGTVLLLAYLALEGPLKRSLAMWSLRVQVLAALAFSLVLVLVAVLFKLSLGTFSVPTTWLRAAAAAAPEAELITPLALSGPVSSAGALFGLAFGAILVQRAGSYETGGALSKRTARFIVGLVGVLFFWRVLGMVLPHDESLLAYALRYLRYALTGLWIAGLAPLVFARIGLARLEPLVSNPDHRLSEKG